MHIIVPMSGIGQRLIDKGYTQPKPLISVDGSPMISHVLDMLKGEGGEGENKITFICNTDHLAETNMRSELERLAPGCNIIGIAPHKKGPVFAVSQCYDSIDDDEEVIVNYCDFYSYWNYSDFLRHTRERHAAGCVPSYRGFHPHMLGTDNYAFIRAEHQMLLEIQEKKPFTDDRMSEFASNGTYYFQKGKFVKKYFDRLMERDISVNGEFYVSMVYNLLVEDGLPVSVYEVQHMLQWGTPLDLEEYQGWSNYFKNCCQGGVNSHENSSKLFNGVNLIPMAGRGSRFADIGIKTPKPLLKVAGKPMFIQAAESLPEAIRYVFVCLKEAFSSELKNMIDESFASVDVVLLDQVTRGQAETCQIGLAQAKPSIEPSTQVLIGACDNGMLFDREKFAELVSDSKVDAVAFTFRNNASTARKPQMYGWIKTAATESNQAVSVSVKVPISENPRKDHAIVGAFYFRERKLFEEGFQSLLGKKVTVNGEYYVDSLFGELISLGYNCRVFEVDNYICWGTPDDWKTFNYWQSFFHKCSWHPYRIENDKQSEFRDCELKNMVEDQLMQETDKL